MTSVLISGVENDDSDFGEENDTGNTEIQVPTEYRIEWSIRVGT
jgi:hypothetical protein